MMFIKNKEDAIKVILDQKPLVIYQMKVNGDLEL